MEETKDNLSNDQQDCACGISNFGTNINVASVSVPVAKNENIQVPSNQIEMDKQDDKIIVANVIPSVESNIANDEIKDLEKSSLECQPNITNKSNLNILSNTESSVSESPISQPKPKNVKEAQNLDEIQHENKTAEVEEEMEQVLIDSEHSKDFIKKKNLKNLSNQTSPLKDLYYIDVNSSLDAIAFQYDCSDSDSSDTDEEDVVPSKIADDPKYRDQNNEIIITSDNSSDSESESSSSDSESDSDSSSSESENDESENEEQKKKNNGPKKNMETKSEFDNLPPIEDLKISVDEVLLDPVGEVAWMVEQMVVVRPKPDKPVLNLDTVLFIEKGKRALGHIFDVFGQVSEPHYCVRFNSSEHIKESDIKVGMVVYYCPNSPYTSLVFLRELTKMKATDDVGDDEPPEFSDDEEEQAYLANLKKKSNDKKNSASAETSNKRRRVQKSVWQSNHPWNKNKNYEQNHSQNPQPFYRTHHPWSRPRYQPQHNNNSWPRYNPYPNNMFHPYRPVFPHYGNQVEMQHFGMQNTGYSQSSWTPPQYPVPQWNSVPLPNFQELPLISVPLPPAPPLPKENNQQE